MNVSSCQHRYSRPTNYFRSIERDCAPGSGSSFLRLPLLSSLLRDFFPSFSKKCVQVFVRNPTSFYGGAKRRENLVECAFAIYFFFNQLLQIVLDVTTFGAGALF